MKYIATIKYGIDSYSKSFDEKKDAEQWLDSQNNNAEYATYIQEVDKNWKVVNTYCHTEAAK